MARVMLATSPEKGHINPMVAVAQRLLAGGHEVAWVCLGQAPPQLRALGAEVLEVASSRPPGREPLSGAAMAAMVLRPEALRRWIRELLIDDVPCQLKSVQELVRRWRPEVVATDPMLYAVVIAASRAGIPWACISSSLNLVAPGELETEMVRTLAELSAERDQLFEAHGLHARFRLCDCVSPHLNTVYATAAFVGNAPLPPATFLVGPSVPEGLRGDEPPFDPGCLHPDRPLVICSFGSQISWQPEIFRKVALAAQRSGAQLLINGGIEAGHQSLALPGSPIIRDYLPQVMLLRRARLLVTHGGANSVMEALWAGVPMLLNPICNDQPTQAWFVRRSGVGRVIALAEAPQAQVDAAMEQLLRRSAPERARSLEVATSYRARDGAGEAASRIAELGRR